MKKKGRVNASYCGGFQRALSLLMLYYFIPFPTINGKLSIKLSIIFPFIFLNLEFQKKIDKLPTANVDLPTEISIYR